MKWEVSTDWIDDIFGQETTIWTKEQFAERVKRAYEYEKAFWDLEINLLKDFEKNLDPIKLEKYPNEFEDYMNELEENYKIKISSDVFFTRKKKDNKEKESLRM